jgi:hypothetical protein
MISRTRVTFFVKSWPEARADRGLFRTKSLSAAVLSKGSSVTSALARPKRSLRQLAIWDKLGYIVVKLGHRLVERSEPGPVCPRELCQVSVGHLTVTDDSLGGHIGVRDIVGPEFMPRVGAGAVEDLSCRAGRLALSDEQSYQAALSDRAGREVAAHADEPVLGGTMVNMIVDEQGDEHVRVEENGH